MDASKIVIDSGGVIYVFPEDGSVISVIEQPEVTSFAWSMSASDDILMAGAPFNLQGQGIYHLQCCLMCYIFPLVYLYSHEQGYSINRIINPPKPTTVFGYSLACEGRNMVISMGSAGKVFVHPK